MLHITRVEDLQSLSHYDVIILCAGANSPEFTSLPVQKIKGQLLVAKADIPRSVIGKGYIAKSPHGCILGSTYERSFESEEPDHKRAEEEILAESRRILSRGKILADRELFCWSAPCKTRPLLSNRP